MPDELSVDAAGLAQPMAVGLHAARRSGVGEGDRVVLIGAGAIGTFVLTALRALADVDLTVIDLPGSRLERATRLGATRVVDAGVDGGDVRDVLGGPADLVIEASGAPGQLDKAVSLPRPAGTVLQVGIPGGSQRVDLHPIVMQEISVLTTLAHVCGDDLGPALDILATTDVSSELLDSVRPLDDVPTQLERLASGGLEGKVLYDPAIEGSSHSSKAAVFHAAQDVRVEEVAAPDGPGPHDVLLRPLWCGICGTDLHEYAMGPIVIPAQPHALNGSQLPQVLGHEFSGEIVAVGNEVTSLEVGQRVSVMPLLYCGQCYYCRRGLNHLCQSMACVGLSYDWGGISELAVVPASHVSVLPDEVSDLQGALVEPGAVAAYGVDTAGVSPGDTVLVTGAGPIGALAALYSAAAGARVFVSEVNPDAPTSRAALTWGTSWTRRPSTSRPGSRTRPVVSARMLSSSARATSARSRPRSRRCAQQAASPRPVSTPELPSGPLMTLRISTSAIAGTRTTEFA